MQIDLKTICFTICVISVVLGICSALSMVWMPRAAETMGKLFVTSLILTGGSFATMAVVKYFSG